MYKKKCKKTLLLFWVSMQSSYYRSYYRNSHLHLYDTTNSLAGVIMSYGLHLQLSVQSVPITTKVVSLNPAQARCTR